MAPQFPLLLAESHETLPKFNLLSPSCFPLHADSRCPGPWATLTQGANSTAQTKYGSSTPVFSHRRVFAHRLRHCHFFSFSILNVTKRHPSFPPRSKKHTPAFLQSPSLLPASSFPPTKLIDFSSGPPPFPHDRKCEKKLMTL